jgi:DNA invertase Pin-like site-specific DNA recombinase
VNDLKQNMPKICAVYARSPRSGPPNIDIQIKNCREAARKHGWVIDDRHVRSDKGKAPIQPMSNRPGLGVLLAAVESGTCPFDRLLIDDNSRLSRRVSEILSVYTTLSRRGISVYVAGSEFHTRSHERAIADIKHIELLDLESITSLELSRPSPVRTTRDPLPRNKKPLSQQENF